MIEPDAVADEMFALLGTGRSTTPISARDPGFDLAAAYDVAALVRARRVARGERVVGRKIGFTNRTIWERYNVHGPIWGSVYDTTLFDLATAPQPFGLAHFSEPRLEPEVIFGIRATPRAGMSLQELIGCCAWVSHGFEIVQSVFPAWRFTAPDTIAGFGLHGALLVGLKHEIAPGGGDWIERLASFEIDLLKDSEVKLHGRGAHVLDSPLSALAHLVEVLAADPSMPPLQPGEVVTTGTLTDAVPIAAGECWSTRLMGISLEGASISF